MFHAARRYDDAGDAALHENALHGPVATASAVLSADLATVMQSRGRTRLAQTELACWLPKIGGRKWRGWPAFSEITRDSQATSGSDVTGPIERKPLTENPLSLSFSYVACVQAQRPRFKTKASIRWRETLPKTAKPLCSEVAVLHETRRLQSIGSSVHKCQDLARKSNYLRRQGLGGRWSVSSENRAGVRTYVQRAE